MKWFRALQLDSQLVAGFVLVAVITALLRLDERKWRKSTRRDWMS